MIIQWVVIYQSEQNDHRRDQRSCALYLCYANPSVRLGLRLLWTLSLLPCSKNPAKDFCWWDLDGVVVVVVVVVVCAVVDGSLDLLARSTCFFI